VHDLKWVVLLLPVLLEASPTCAQETPGQGEATDPETTLAELREAYASDPDPELRYRIGKLLHELGRDDEAEIELRAYLDEVEHPTEMKKMEVQSILYEILTSEHPLYKKAKYHLRVKQFIEAREALIAYLEQEKDGMSALRRSQVEALLAEADAHISEVTFSCNVQAASVYVSGIFVGTLPLGKPLLLAEGEYPVEVGAGGYTTAKKVVQVSAGEDKHLKIMLTRTETDQTCQGISCSGHGLCIISSGFPQCLCNEGYEGSSSGLECNPIKVDVPLVKSTSILSIVLSGIGAVGTIVGPLLYTQDHFEAGLGVTIPAFVFLSAGVPLGIETLARYARTYNAKNLRSTYIGARSWAIAGFTVGTPLLVSGLITNMMSLVVVGLIHHVALAATGIALAARAIVAEKNRERMQPVLSIPVLPTLSPVAGGAVLGLTGRF